MMTTKLNNTTSQNKDKSINQIENEEKTRANQKKDKTIVEVLTQLG